MTDRTSDDFDDREEVQALLAAIRKALPELEDLLEKVSDHWGYEDPIYRFYHQSWKVYGLQQTTLRIVEALQRLLQDRPLNPWFRTIVTEGTGKRFASDHNQRWIAEARPILEAFFHARYFLEMAVRSGRTLERPPRILPSGWAAVLALFDLR